PVVLSAFKQRREIIAALIELFGKVSESCYRRANSILLHSALIGFRVAVRAQFCLCHISLSPQLPDQPSNMLYLLVDCHRKSLRFAFTHFPNIDAFSQTYMSCC